MSLTEEKAILEAMVKHAGFLSTHISEILHHLGAACELYSSEKFPVSVGEARKFIEALISGIAKETADHRGDPIPGVLPGGNPLTSPRITYLGEKQFLTGDRTQKEQAALRSTWEYLRFEEWRNPSAGTTQT